MPSRNHEPADFDSIRVADDLRAGGPAVRRRLVEAIHAGPLRLGIVLNGGGSLTASDLLTVPGASRSVLEVLVPYAPAAAIELLGKAPEAYCSAETARRYAAVARQRASRFARPAAKDTPDRRIVGLGCTAALATARDRRGADRIFIAALTDDAVRVRSAAFAAPFTDRDSQEAAAALLVLDLLAELSGCVDRPSLPAKLAALVSEVRVEALPPWKELLTGQAVAACRPANGAGPYRTLSPGEAAEAGLAILPGSFHPRHAGHSAMAAVAEELLGVPVRFELSVFNVDKPPLDYADLAERTAAFPDRPLWLTSARRFVEKAELFPGATFVVGADTIVRLADPKYCGGDAAVRDATVERLAERGCRFLVFGRREGERFRVLSDLDLPPRLRDLCREVPADRFRNDLSSTELRRGSHA